MTINELHPENGDHLQTLTFCEILPVHISRGCLLVGGTHVVHRLLKPVCQSSTLFLLLFMAITFDDTTIKHLIYYPFSVLKGPVWFFSGFEIHCKKNNVLYKVLQKF